MEATKPLVSIIMNCFNGEKYLYEAIKSIVNQTYVNWELIFWDNQSTDGSAQIVNSFRDERIKYFFSDVFTDLGGARHRACTHVNGDYLAILDVDDFWHPEKLENQLELFKDPSTGICISNTIFFNSKKKSILYSKDPPTGYVTENLIENYYISLESILLKMEYVKELNIFFDSRFSHIADFDLLTRLSTICQLVYCPQILSGWRIHNENASFRENEKFIIEKLKWISCYKNSELFANYQRSINNLEIYLKAESPYLKLSNEKLKLSDFFKYSGSLKSKIMIIISFFPCLYKLVRLFKKILFKIRWS
tara:strand:- start:1248 stop:2168 length:921 start_codon:yes stop_codon:yes gene_type:complete